MLSLHNIFILPFKYLPNFFIFHIFIQNSLLIISPYPLNLHLISSTFSLNPNFTIISSTIPIFSLTFHSSKISSITSLLFSTFSLLQNQSFLALISHSMTLGNCMKSTVHKIHRSSWES